MASIKVRNSENLEDSLRFSVGEMEFSLIDLRSAFPSAHSLRYKDNEGDDYHHVICRDGIFREPTGGWEYEGREYIAMCSSHAAQGEGRFGQFQAFRRQITGRHVSTPTSSRHGNQATSDRSSTLGRKESQTTMISVGVGHFISGKFSRISAVNLSSVGGTVAVGPYSKTEETKELIRKDSFDKFCTQNQYFRRIYKSPDEFMLVYPDGSEVNRLPDNSANFTILGYRNYIDPRRRYDRLRLYLCLKEHVGEKIEIMTDSSSDDDLPDIEIGTRRSQARDVVNNSLTQAASTLHNESHTRSSTPTNDTLPLTGSPTLVVECRIQIYDRLVREFFPNNAAGKDLIAYVAGQSAAADDLTITTISGRVITSDSRLSELTGGSSVLELKAQRRMPDEEDGPISGSPNNNNNEVANALVETAANQLGTTSEPVTILKKYTSIFLRGRPLDLETEEETIEGETSQIFVSRRDIFRDATEEISLLENIRLPIDVTFYGEEAVDFGGPRREFFVLVLKEIKDKLLEERGESVLLRECNEDLALQRYFTAGVVIAGRRSPITLEKIMSFATSSEKEPALGFPMRPSLHFTDGIFATSNTCIFRMCLPLLNKDRGEDDYFAKLDLAFANSYFGLQ